MWTRFVIWKCDCYVFPLNVPAAAVNPLKFDVDSKILNRLSKESIILAKNLRLRQVVVKVNTKQLTIQIKNYFTPDVFFHNTYRSVWLGLQRWLVCKSFRKTDYCCCKDIKRCAKGSDSYNYVNVWINEIYLQCLVKSYIKSSIGIDAGDLCQEQFEALLRESVTMKLFNHPNVMSLIGVCLDRGLCPTLCCRSCPEVICSHIYSRSGPL